MEKICTFYTKNEVFCQKFRQNLQIFDKNCSFVSKNVHSTFYSKNEVFAKKFHQNVKIKTVVLYPKMYIWC